MKPNVAFLCSSPFIYKANTTTTRSPRTTSVAFCVVSVNNEHTKPWFKINVMG